MSRKLANLGLAALIFTTGILISSCNPRSEIPVENLGRISFLSNETELVGRVDFPDGPGPFPGVVIVHGSGRQTRSGASFVTNNFLENGIAVMRYDKRGVGDSDGTYFDVNPGNSASILNLLAEDALAAVQFLRNQDHINSDLVGLYGASQAGWIIPLTASISTDIAFSVIVVGPTVTVGEEIFYSRLTNGNSSTMSEEDLDEISSDLARFPGPHGFDPRAAIAAMNRPALWVLGGQDASIPTRETIEVLEEIKSVSGNEIDIHLFPTGTHSMRDVESGRQLPFMTEVVIPWVKAQIGASEN